MGTGRISSNVNNDNAISKPLGDILVLEQGVRAPVFYGNLLEQTGGHGFLQIPTGILVVLTYISESLRKPSGVYGIM